MSIIQDPREQQAFQDGVREIVDAATKEAQQKEKKDDIIKAVAEKFELKAAEVRKVAMTVFKEEYQKKVDEWERFEELYNTAIKKDSGAAETPQQDKDGEWFND